MIKEDIENRFKDIFKNIIEQLKYFFNFEDIKKFYDEQVEKVIVLVEVFDKIKEKGGYMIFVNEVEKVVGEFFDSFVCQDYFVNCIKIFGFMNFDLKGIVFIIESFNMLRSNNCLIGCVVIVVNEQKLNFCDLMMVEQGDLFVLFILYEQVYDFDCNVMVVVENGMLVELLLKFKEEFMNVKCIGIYMNLLKCLLKVKQYVVLFIFNCLFLWVKFFENYQIMFGDGIGDNLKGIICYEGVDCVFKFIVDNYVIIFVGVIELFEVVNGQIIIILVVVNDKIIDKMKVILLGVIVEIGLNDIFDIYKINDCKFVIDFDYKGIEILVVKMFGVIKSGMFGFVEDLNMKDVVNVIFVVFNFGQYLFNVLVLYLFIVFIIFIVKDIIGRNFELIIEVNGCKYIGNVFVIECNVIGVGKYFVGDFLNGCFLIDYIILVIEFVDDVNIKLKNMIIVMIQEELMMFVYMFWVFVYGDLDDVLEVIIKFV